MSRCRVPRPVAIALTPALLAFLISVALLCCPASAHKPIIEERDTTGYDNAIPVIDPGVSWAVYGYLDSPGDVDFYSFEINGPLNLSAGILVPVRDAYRSFRPSYAIVGPGINGTPPMPFSLPPETGALVFNMSQDSKTFYEPFGGIDYWQSPVSHSWLERPGTYYVVVFDRAHGRGDYVLAIGEKESFSPADLPGVLWSVLRIRAGALDHSKKVSGSKQLP